MSASESSCHARRLYTVESIAVVGNGVRSLSAWKSVASGVSVQSLMKANGSQIELPVELRRMYDVRVGELFRSNQRFVDKPNEDMDWSRNRFGLAEICSLQLQLHGGSRS